MTQDADIAPPASNRNALPHVLRLVLALMDDLYPAERRVAEYLARDPSNSARISVTEVADGANTSEATVVRLCKKAGFTGFQGFKNQLLREMVSPVQSIHEEITEGDRDWTILQKVFQSNVAALQETARVLDERQVTQAVELLTRASKVLFIGVSNSGLVAKDALLRFLRLGLTVHAETGGHDQAVRAALLEPGDVCVALSHSGASRDVLEAVDIGRERGAKIIAVTNRPRSSLGRVSDIVFTTAAQETAFRTEAMASRIAMLVIMDTLFIATAMRQPQLTADHIQRIRDATAGKRL